MEPADLADAVIQTSGRPEVRAAVAQLYNSLEREIARRRPLCVMSGRCCHFDDYGHRLYVTTMELATFRHEYLQSSPPPQNPDEHGCRFQTGKLCGVHAIRPMGCRLFFCDPSSTQWQNEQYERFHSQLKRLHE